MDMLESAQLKGADSPSFQAPALYWAIVGYMFTFSVLQSTCPDCY